MGTRLHWIDLVKAICMIGVYIAHTEAFTTQYGILGKFVLPFYVNAFFFISGFLLYSKYLKSGIITNYSFTTYRKGLQNSIFKIAIPTIIFAGIISLPKMFFHGRSLNIGALAVEILGGTSFWFTSALFVAQVILLTLFLTKKKEIFFYFTLAVILFLIVQMTCDYNTKPAIEYFPWFWRTGLNYLLIMSIGGLYATYQNCFKKLTTWISVIVGIIGYYMIFTGHNVACLGLSGRCNFIGFITSIATTLVLIEMAKKLKTNKIINFIGENSMIFYFLSGASPATFATISAKLNITGIHAFNTSLILSLISSYIITYIIVKYMPFLTDIRLIKQ